MSYIMKCQTKGVYLTCMIRCYALLYKGNDNNDNNNKGKDFLYDYNYSYDSDDKNNSNIKITIMMVINITKVYFTSKTTVMR